MRRFAETIFIIMITGSLLMGACDKSSSNVESAHAKNNITVDDALTALLNSENYKSQWLYERKVLWEGEMKEFDGGGTIVIFHNPYKSKVSFTYDQPSETGVVSGNFYEIQEGDNYKQERVYKLENGDTKQGEIENSFSEEWLLTQIKSCLLSEKYVEEQTLDGINVKKYKITFTAYPFINEFGFSRDKTDTETRIFISEYGACEGYIYINSETNNIQKIEIDLSEKMALNKKITERINETGHRLFKMLDYDKFRISIIISNINDDSKDIKDTEKEIDGIMQ